MDGTLANAFEAVSFLPEMASFGFGEVRGFASLLFDDSNSMTNNLHLLQICLSMYSSNIAHSMCTVLVQEGYL